MNARAVIVFYRGNDLALACSYTIDDAPASLAGITVDAQVRTAREELVATLTVERINDAAGAYVLRAPYAGTTAWPEGDLYLDIRYTQGPQRRNTSRCVLRVLQPVTVGA